MKMQRIGELAFILFVLIAIVAGLTTYANPSGGYGVVVIAMILLGVIVGFINISEKETIPFLVAAIALLAAGTANFEALGLIGKVVSNILDFVGAFVAPATVIVSLKAIYSLSAKK
ncbi:MAG: hypothetical protein QMD85_04300 [Candidatus Aenigmarchaeota archaeon]|nr:hypothetical protein [Candidatus Aenigmarchaeota archaeon]MDI6722797.1 hypothetical protein [Candidatus Aenigmarchaeota archaeon]